MKLDLLASIAAALLVAGASVAAEIAVIGPDGQPVSDAAVACTHGAAAVVLTNEHGRCTMPPACTEATCEKGGFLAGTAPILGPLATCRLWAETVVHGRVAMSPGNETYMAALESGPERRIEASGSVRRDEEQGGPGEFRIEAAPGTYVLVIRRFPDFWSCETDLPPLGAGDHEIAAGWREPVAISGTVLDENGRPYPKVLLKIEDESGPEQPVRCEPGEQALDVVSGPDGRFRALVDPDRAHRIVAHPAWQPATVRIDPDPAHPDQHGSP